MKYNKVTEAMPDVGEEVVTYNGEVKIFNYYDGKNKGWRYQYRCPFTHWRYTEQTPEFREVQQVRQQLT